MRWTIYLLTLCAVAFNASAQPTAYPKLFKSYIYDAPLSEFVEKSGYYDCSSDMGGTARCIDNVAFLDHQFTAVLKFVDKRLASVVLVTDFGQELYLRVSGALAKTFTLCALQGTTERLDLIELSRKSKSKAAFDSRLDSFESLNLSNGNLTYIFVERPMSELRRKRNAVEAIMSAPPGTRSAELTVAEEASNQVLLITFTLPKLTLQKIKKAMEVPVEKF